ncbi:adenine phosphoribosyltransferase isoform X2 [Festucalex cinctus]
MEGRSDSKIELLRRSIRAVPDFPKKGILFRDICPILKDPTALTVVIDLFEEHVKNKNWEVDLIVGLDARGFLFGPLLAQRLGVGFVMVRKKGKLPGATVSVAYDLEYGKAEAEIQEDAVAPGQKVVILDDLLATGGVILLPASPTRLTRLTSNLGCTISTPGTTSWGHTFDCFSYTVNPIDFKLGLYHLNTWDNIMVKILKFLTYYMTVAGHQIYSFKILT